MLGASQWRIYYHRKWGQLSTTSSNVPKQPNGELQVAVSQNQLRTMASETVDPIDWSHPPPSWAVLPERLVHSINQCNLRRNRTCNRNTRGNHLACAATQGIYQGLLASMSPEQAVDVRASFLFVGDLNGHHPEFLCSTTTNQHGVAAFDSATVSSCDQLVVCPTHARGGTIDS